MRFFSLLCFCLVFVGLVTLQSCDTDSDPTPTLNKIYPETILISENGAPQYPLRELEVTRADYTGGLAVLEITGKLNNGKKLLLTFTQSDPTVGANKTNALEADLEGSGGMTESSSTTMRNSASLTVTGNFKATFASGFMVDGVLKEVKLPY